MKGDKDMGSLTVHVLDEDQNPISGEKVYCIFPGAVIGILSLNSECYTDDDGIAEFDDVPTGSVEIYVDGSLQLEIGVGAYDHEDVTITIY